MVWSLYLSKVPVSYNVPLPSDHLPSCHEIVYSAVREHTESVVSASPIYIVGVNINRWIGSREKYSKL